ncbi:chain-length determining protein [Agaricicola taiwanensis]|uniref:non-specific protein-tyrosine kinase n=1 Tax=Agaricicola taiwanensis TaxID=591372 RepID=A0A8J2YJV5_9RHOB|nr:AAA family ATPase [Agaricicola taiwanensis]GGE48820.1 chain-length determining protein [Agaricicola taiwanensis]
MLDVSRLKHPAAPDQGAQPGDKIIDLHAILGFVRREKFTIIGSIVFCLGLAIAYLVLAKPTYVASADVLIDTRRLELFRDESVFQPDQQLNTGAVESQITVMTSNEVLGQTVDALNLTEDPAFFEPSLTGQIKDLLGLTNDEPPTEEELRLAAIRKLRFNVAVRRIGLSYVISISFPSTDPVLAAKIANGIANAYIQDQLNTRSSATENAGDWLRERLEDLRRRSFEADTAVQEFRVANNLMDVGRGTATRRVSDQQVEELTTQLTTAQSKVAETQARVDQLDAVLKSNAEVVGIPETISNEIIIRLRQEYLDAARQEAELSARYGKNHISASNLRAKMENIQNVIRTELSRLAETARAEFAIAQAREAQTRRNLEVYIGTANQASKASIQLRELESTAEAYRALYNGFLTRYMQTAEQQSFRMTDARIISRAPTPTTKAAPKTSLVLAGGLILGLGLGGGISILRALLDRVIRTTHQVETITGTPCLGILPRYEKAATNSARADSAENPDQQITRAPTGVQALAVDEPASHFAETIRAIKVAVDLAGISRETKVIGVISSVPTEGKTTVSVNLAQIMGQSGKRALLIDGDLRNPSLTRELAPRATAGIIEVMRNEVQPTAAAWQAPNGTFDFLPAVPGRVTASTSDVLASPAMNAVLTAARKAYDYIVIDLAPVLSSVDARAAAMLMDAFVLVVEWGETQTEVLTETMNTSMIIQERLLGTVLNKADLKVMRSFEHVPDTYY